MKKKSIRILSWLLTLIVFFMSINLSFISKAEGNGPSVYINPSNTQAIYTYDGYYVVFNLNGSWNGGHNVGIQIYNTSSEIIEDWTLESDYSNNISNIWNASVIENANGQTRIYHDTWNSIIYPNSCVEFGFSSNETFASFPSYFGILESEMIETNSELFSIDYNVTDEWEDGYTGLVTITNNSENVIRNWALNFSCNNENISVWNAELISKEGNRVSVGNMGFNADINPGENVSFGFIVYNKTNNDAFYDYSLSESVFITNEPQRELEPLGDIGEAYCKELRDEDVIFDEETWLCYAKNQLLISAYWGTPRELVEEIISEVGATIVGYIEFTSDYQIEFAENKSLEELQMIAEYIEGHSFISAVTLNLAIEESGSVNFYNDNKTFEMRLDSSNGNPYNYTVITISSDIEKWDESAPEGDNWNLETIHAQSAWNKILNPYKVKVGVYDSYFENNRNDKELIFDDIINPDENIELTIKNQKHGTHVAGSIGASNDGNGIVGVSPEVELYGYSFLRNHAYTGMMERKIGFAKLILNHVKIINVSVGYVDKTRTILASYDNMEGCEKSRTSIKKEADLFAEFLDKLVQAGYDFLIVNSAGNDNCKYYIKEMNNNLIKYTECPEGVTGDLYVTEIDSKYNYFLTAIEDDALNNRIIVVGSMNYSRAYSSFSNIGPRVDICAPGENILSAVPYSVTYPDHPEAYSGYELLSGTSQAAPHISGIAALMLQANPQLSSEQLKSIICDYSNSTQRTYTNSEIGNYSYYMPLADKCVEKALNTAPFNKNTDIDWPMGMIAGSIKDSYGYSVPNTKIIAKRVSTGEYNVLNSYFELFADNEGNYTDSLPEGKYDLYFYSDSSLAAKYNGIEIIADNITYLNVELCNKNNSSSRIRGIIIDGITGMPVENAQVKVRKNWNSTEGSYVKTYRGDVLSDQSNEQGKFVLPKDITGSYTVEIIKDGYLAGYFNVTTVLPEEGAEEETFVLSPILPDDEYRIILTWNSSPRDLDSHLTYYDDNDEKQLHVYFGQLDGYYNDKKIAQLDLDDTSGYGPETVTITLNTDCIDSGYFRYSVYNFSNELSMSQSNATIRVYHGREKAQIFYVPLEADENTWCVFELSKDGIITKNECFHTYGSSEVQ